jgi:hypothetical protein
MSTPPDENTPAPSPLDHVVDDETPRREALEWATAELAAGNEFETVCGELIASGWSADDAAEIVELARQVTRPLRGAQTRAQIVGDLNRRHRKATSGGWFIGLPTVSAAMRLLHGLGSLLSLRRRGGRGR